MADNIHSFLSVKRSREMFPFNTARNVSIIVAFWLSAIGGTVLRYPSKPNLQVFKRFTIFLKSRKMKSMMANNNESKSNKAELDVSSYGTFDKNDELVEDLKKLNLLRRPVEPNKFVSAVMQVSLYVGAIGFVGGSLIFPIGDAVSMHRYGTHISAEHAKAFAIFWPSSLVFALLSLFALAHYSEMANFILRRKKKAKELKEKVGIVRAGTSNLIIEGNPLAKKLYLMDQKNYDFSNNISEICWEIFNNSKKVNDSSVGVDYSSTMLSLLSDPPKTKAGEKALEDGLLDMSIELDQIIKREDEERAKESKIAEDVEVEHYKQAFNRLSETKGNLELSG